MGLKRAMMLGLDGADPLVVKKMIAEGRLPNLKKVLEEGVANKNLSMVGAYPSVTPPNWASIATGNWPRTHGVTCFFNQTLGDELDLAQLNWDSRRVESELIWEAFSREGKRSIMLNYCEAWPPRIKDDPYAVYVDGTGVIPFIRCQIDSPQFITLREGNFPTEVSAHGVKDNASDCIISTDMLEEMMGNDDQQAAKAAKEQSEADPYEDTPLIEFPFKVYTPEADDEGAGIDEVDRITAALKAPEKWSFELPEGAKVAIVPLAKSTVRRYFVITASDGKTYDTLTIYANRKDTAPIGQTKVGEWTENIFDTFTIDDKPVKVAYRIRLIELAADGNFAQMLMTNAMDIENLDYFYPRAMGKKLLEEVGPMMPHAKLGDVREDAGIIEFEAWANLFDWHIDATKWLFNEYPDWQLFYVHLHGIDIFNHWYINHTLPGWDKRSDFYQELLYKMYEINDKYVGAMLEYLDGDTSIIITSDHAAIPNSPGDKNPGFGHLSGIAVKVMEDLGYTVLHEETRYTKKPKIDWSRTKAICARLGHVYVNLKGRDPQGIVESEEYNAVVEQLISDLYSYRHPETGKRVVAFCMTRNEMESIGLGGPHCGDIIVELMPTYCETHGNCPTTVAHEGYSLDNLLMMIGAGLKKGELFRRVARVTDVVPTICHLTDTQVPSNTEGGIIWQALEGFQEEQYTRKPTKGK
ncbi:alkaline phosphatase family protein [Dehalobacter sp. DCM]|uniref:alkaline phosphatase family protein n=1 Tax=Dehalobacter sp. DCM TaxID=2907827 RepID=UPI003081305F|nr:alkaline phosphatase family protein [Dehalobacter sp. DCM]